MTEKKPFRPDHIPDYFRQESIPLILVTVFGLIYNVGLLAGPWFEGRMAECLLQVLRGQADFSAMLRLVIGYVLSIGIVQGARYIKRFYIRRFANNVNRSMKKTLYASLVRKSRREMEQEGAGNILTKAISDVDDCVEGMRKFTTEIFDTGIAMISYIVMLLFYDWRLALLCLIFPPISYWLAEHMKKNVQRAGAAFKQETGALSAATLDRVSNAVTYRVHGCEELRAQAYEKQLDNYEHAAVRSGILATALQPLYQVISMVSVLFILYFGARNVAGTGWTAWDIAAFTTFLSCVARLAVKSSKAAKLFNAVHKAEVSWKRIRPYMEEDPGTPAVILSQPAPLSVRGLSFAYPGGRTIFSEVSFDASPGAMIGITGQVACGKSTLGKVFLCEYPYEGSIRFGGRELRDIPECELRGIIGYLGHDTELQNDSVRNNILPEREENIDPWLQAVCLETEAAAMEQGTDTAVGASGNRLSGGQAQRVALARTMAHARPLVILDDPFSALDRTTEEEVFRHLRETLKGSTILLISHRLELFPQMDQVLWMDNGHVTAGTHAQLMQSVPRYAELYRVQEGAKGDEN